MEEVRGSAFQNPTYSTKRDMERAEETGVEPCLYLRKMSKAENNVALNLFAPIKLKEE